MNLTIAYVSQTWIFIPSESSTAEMYPPLLPYIVFHQTIKQEDKEAWNTAKKTKHLFEDYNPKTTYHLLVLNTNALLCLMNLLYKLWISLCTVLGILWMH